MNREPVRSRIGIVFVLCYLIIGAVFARMLPFYWPTPERWIVLGGLIFYTVLFVLERPLSKVFRLYIHLAFVIQIFITLILTLVIAENDSPQDYFMMLLVPLCVQIAWGYSRRSTITWVVVLCVIAETSMIAYFGIFDENWSGLGLGLSYVAACFLGSVFTWVTRRSEEARRQTQVLNVELQEANRKLQDYAQQVEHLAATEERSRLARDLHDSVSQTIFSMTLTAQAARILIERDPSRVTAKLDHLQALAQNALAEMRYLIQHLGPSGLADAGLRECLLRLADERRRQDGLDVEMQVVGDRRLPVALEEGIYRLAQEALNNIVKHAHTDRAWVTLRLDQELVSLCIEDHGAGFDPAQVRQGEGHLGLAGMNDRARILGGRLTIDSRPGAGTRIMIDGIQVKEGEHA